MSYGKSLCNDFCRYWSWADDAGKVASIDTSKGLITLEEPIKYGLRTGKYRPLFWQVFLTPTLTPTKTKTKMEKYDPETLMIVKRLFRTRTI